MDLQCFGMSSANLGQRIRGIASGNPMSTPSGSANRSPLLVQNPARISQTNEKVRSPLRAHCTPFIKRKQIWGRIRVRGSGPNPLRGGAGWVSAIGIAGVGLRRGRGRKRRLDALMILETISSSRVFCRSLDAQQLLLLGF